MLFNLNAQKKQHSRQSPVNGPAYLNLKDEMPNLQKDLLLTGIAAALKEHAIPGSTRSDIFLRQLVRANELSFVIRLAIRIREDLRQTPLALRLTAELAAQSRKFDWIDRIIGSVLVHPADLPGWIGYYLQYSGRRRMPRALRKALGPVFLPLDEFRYTRLDREHQLLVKDALALVRPAPASRVQRNLFAAIAGDKLPARSSWEQQWKALLAEGDTGSSERQAVIRDKWREGISSFQMGYALLLESLPVLLEAGVSGRSLKLTAAYLRNAAIVAASKQSPFAIRRAYHRIRSSGQGGSPMLLEALEEALVHSGANLGGFDTQTRVLVAMDVSHSMTSPLHAGNGVLPQQNDGLQRFDVGPLIAMSLGPHAQVTAGIIGNTWKSVALPKADMLKGGQLFHVHEGEAGYACNAHLVIADLVRKGMIMDKVMIFTDSSLWNSRHFHQAPDTDIKKLWEEYRQLAPGARLYLFDLSGNANLRLDNPEEHVYLVSGWNEGIFNALRLLDQEVKTI